MVSNLQFYAMSQCANHNLSRILLLIISLTLATNIIARRIRIMNTDRVPLESAIISAIIENDSTAIETTITDCNGYANFSLDSLSAITMQVERQGYQTFNGKLSINDSIIFLEPETKDLQEIVIMRSADYIKVNAGKVSFAPGELKQQVSTTINLLKLSPMIEVSDNNISILGGRPVKLFLNGQDTKIPNEYATQILNAINPKEIKNLEILANGNQSSNGIAILNINLIDHSQGINGIIRAIASLNQERPSTSENISLNYTKDKINASLIINYNFFNAFSHTSSIYRYNDISKIVTDDSKSYAKSHSIAAQARVVYSNSPKSELGLWASVGTSSYHKEISVTSLSKIFDDEYESQFKNLLTTPWSKPFIKAVAYWTYKTDSKGSMIDLTADYYHNKTESHNSYNSDNIEQLEMETYRNLKNGLHSCVKYIHYFSAGQSISFAYDYSLAHLKYYTIGLGKIHNFKYVENKHDGEISWNSTWTKNLQTFASVTLEATHTHGDSNPTDENFKQKSKNILPRLGLSLYIPKASQSLSIRSGLGIELPYFAYLNPEIFWTSETTFTTGNPNLSASKTWYVDLDYSLNNYFFTNINFYNTNNLISDYTYFMDGNTISSYANMGKRIGVNANFQFIKMFWNFWRVNLRVNCKYDNFKGGIDSASLDYTNFSTVISLMNMVILSRKYGWNISINYSYKSPIKNITSKTFSWHDLSINLNKIFSNGLSISLYGGNLLNNKIKANFHTLSYGYETRNLEFPMNFSIELTYTFGNKAVNPGHPRNITKMDER